MQLSICIFADSEQLTQSLTQVLKVGRYRLNALHTHKEFESFVTQHKEQIDCLVFINNPSSEPLLKQLYEQGTLLPAIIIDEDNTITFPTDHDTEGENQTYLYHSGEVRLAENQIPDLVSFIDQAIAQFLHLTPSCALSERPPKIELVANDNTETFLQIQQRRLSQKLKERLGYLGLYYKRNPKFFYRNLSPKEKTELTEQLRKEYRQIILNYFAKEININTAIDQYVNRAFFADVSVEQVLEIHMELIDEFSQQLKLEGRSDEILLDYRLTLIDIMAHLCEMYRRSLPREDI